jgi:hypothetical protein
VTPQRCTQHIRRGDTAEYSYRFNPETGRRDVFTRRPDGTEEPLPKVSFLMPDEAMNHVALLTGKPPDHIPPGEWVSTEE